MRDYLATGALSFLLLLILNPMHFWMPTGAHILSLVLLVAVTGMIVVFLTREGSEDERDITHRAFAGRVAFLGGALVILLGIVSQGFFGKVDAWLAAALITMVTLKIAARAYADRRL
jgi:predicted ABC-type exoprotein transport system permease subunit